MRNYTRVIICLLLFCNTLLQAQQRPIQSLYMFDPLLINPAYAGNQVQLSATAIYRNQWVNLDGAPKTFTATAHSGFKKRRLGLGFIVSNDQIGIHNDVGVYGVYSYKIPISRKGTLSFGLQGGFNNLRSDYNKLILKNQGDPSLGGVVTKMNPNVGAGIYFRQDNFYAGFSVPYLLDNKVVGLENVGNVSKQQRYYYLTGGFTSKVSNRVKIVPSALIRIQDQAPISFDLNTVVVLYDAVGLGCSYRLGDAVVALFELQLNENFHVGYAYDITTSALSQYSNGSHELMINYRIKISRWHKGLECPTYW
jgi:type IX secretion system PorP/SprF family membrane protein